MNVRGIIILLLSATLTAACSVAAEPQSNAVSARESNSPLRSISAIQSDVHAALRAEASTRRLGQNAPEVLALIELYREMADHPKRDSSRVLARLGLRLRSRLEDLRDHIQRQHSAPERRAKIQPTLTAPETHVLAQQVAAPGGVGLAPGAQPAGPRAGAAGIMDYGPELVEIIQQTISPATWDINGGLGAVVYYAPLRVLVVSAPGTVHDEVGDVLGQLRAVP